MVILAIADEATIKQLDREEGNAGRSNRSAQNHRRGGAANHQNRETNLLAQ